MAKYEYERYTWRYVAEHAEQQPKMKSSAYIIKRDGKYLEVEEVLELLCTPTDAAPGEAELLREALREYQDAFYSAVEGNRSGAVNDLLYEYFDLASKKAARDLRGDDE